jgi:hypothetical protein
MKTDAETVIGQAQLRQIEPSRISMAEFLRTLLRHYFKTYASGNYLGVMMESNPEAVVFKKAIWGQDHWSLVLLV